MAFLKYEIKSLFVSGECVFEISVGFLEFCLRRAYREVFRDKCTPGMGDKIYIFTAKEARLQCVQSLGGFYQLTREVQPSSTHRS